MLRVWALRICAVLCGAAVTLAAIDGPMNSPSMSVLDKVVSVAIIALLMLAFWRWDYPGEPRR